MHLFHRAFHPHLQPLHLVVHTLHRFAGGGVQSGAALHATGHTWQRSMPMPCRHKMYSCAPFSNFLSRKRL